MVPESTPPPDLPPPDLADVLALLDADPHGCALARAVRAEDGSIVDFTLVYLNEAGGRFLGRPRHELIGRDYRSLWPDTVTDGTLPLYRRVVQSREAAVRTVYYDRDSVAGHFEFRVVPFGDGFIARFVDLTKLTMGAQTQGGARLYAALDAAFDGFTLLRAVRDDGGAIVDFAREYVNQIGAKLAGSTVEDLVGRLFSQSASSTAEYGLLARFREVADGGETWQQQLTSPDVAQVFEIKVVRVSEDFVAVSYRDITAQADHQEQLALSAAQVQTAADRATVLQSVTAALVAARTPEDVYAAMGAVVRPSAGGHGIVVLLVEQDQLVLRYHAGYEQDVVEQLRVLPMSHPYPAAEVSTTGRARYLESPAEFAAAQPAAGPAISGGGRAAWAFLPLTSGGQVLGTMVIGYTRPRQFDDDERATLTAFSRLAAQALHRALLYQAQASIAADLQRALLPAVLPRLRGARHAVRYLPWTAGADVGGDWYDVIPLGPDTAAMVIGDVAGHSLQAAATMGQLRNAIRAYAADGHSPTGVMHRANQVLRRFEPHAMASCCYLELHLDEGTATAVLAGHPSPVLRTGDLARQLRLHTGPPLGVVGTAEYVESTFLLPTGCTLLLYTDGLIEDRRYDIDRGLSDLCAAVRSARDNDPDGLIEHILRAGVGQTPRRDDVAVLALTLDADRPAGSPGVRRRFRGDAASAAAARRFAGDVLTAWGHHQLRADACLLLDEIVTNAVQHTVGDVEVHLILGQRLRIEVHDTSDRHPVTRPAPADSATGRGLHLIGRLSHAWGSAPLPGHGKLVWCELDLPTVPDP